MASKKKLSDDLCERLHQKYGTVRIRMGNDGMVKCFGKIPGSDFKAVNGLECYTTGWFDVGHVDTLSEKSDVNEPCPHYEDNQGFCHKCGILMNEDWARQSGYFQEGMVEGK